MSAPAPGAAALLAGRRVVIVLGPLEIGGAERQALLLARGLRDDFGAEVEVWGTMGAPGRAAATCDRHGLPWRIVPMGIREREPTLRRSLRGWRRLLAFGQTLRDAHPDVVISFMTMPNINAALTWRYAGAAVGVWGQRDNGSSSSGWWLERLAAHRASLLIANSHHGAGFLARALGVKRERIAVVGNGIRLPEAVETREQWRARLGADENAFVAVMVGNLHRAKDHPTLLRAWKTLAERSNARGPATILALAGRFDTEHDRLRTLAAELGIAGSVRFLGEVADVAGLLDACDVGVLSTFGEGLPNSVLEYMSAGLPVVASDCPGVREAVGEEGGGYLPALGSHEEMAEMLVELEGDRERRRAIGERLRARVEAMFSEHAMVSQTAALIADGLARSPKGAVRIEQGMHLEHGMIPEGSIERRTERG